MKNLRIAYAVLLIVGLGLLCGCGTGKEAEDGNRKIKIVFAVHRDDTGAIKSITEDFMRRYTDISVKTLTLSDQSTENHRILSSMMTGNEIPVDIMEVEDIWMREFTEQGYLRPVMSGVDWNPSEYPDRFSEFLKKNGECYGIPFELDTGMMYYQKESVYGKLDFAEILQNNNIKYFLNENDGEDRVCTVMECIRLSGDVSKGIKLYKDLYNAASNRSQSPAESFGGGDAAYMRGWSSFNNQLHMEMDSGRKNIRAAALSSNGKNYATARLYCLAVNAQMDKEKEEAAAKLLNFMLEENTQLEINKKKGTIPLKYKFYNNPVVLDYNEFNEELGSCLNNLNYRVLCSDYTQLSKEAQEELEGVLSGGSDEAAAEKIKLLME